jgi:hypothetical protein
LLLLLLLLLLPLLLLLLLLLPLLRPVVLLVQLLPAGLRCAVAGAATRFGRAHKMFAETLPHQYRGLGAGQGPKQTQKLPQGSMMRKHEACGGLLCSLSACLEGAPLHLALRLV